MIIHLFGVMIILHPSPLIRTRNALIISCTNDILQVLVEVCLPLQTGSLEGHVLQLDQH